MPTDELKYYSFEVLGAEVFIEIFELCLQGCTSPQFQSKPAAECLASLKIAAGAAFRAEHWLVAVREKQAVGMVLAQAGTVIFVGVLPEFRKQGLAKMLRAKASELS